MCQVFVLLAGGASFDIVFYSLIHAWPLVLLFCGLGGLVSAWVSSGQGIVIVLHNLPPEFYFGGNCYSTVFEPLGLVVMCGVEVKVVCIFPLFHLPSIDSLGICYLSF